MVPLRAGAVTVTSQLPRWCRATDIQILRMQTKPSLQTAMMRLQRLSHRTLRWKGMWGTCLSQTARKRKQLLQGELLFVNGGCAALLKQAL